MARLTVATSLWSCADAAGLGITRPFLGERDPLECLPLGGREAQRRADPAGQGTRRLAGPAGDPVVGQVVAEFEPRGVGAAGVVSRPEPPAPPGEEPDRHGVTAATPSTARTISAAETGADAGRPCRHRRRR